MRTVECVRLTAVVGAAIPSLLVASRGRLVRSLETAEAFKPDRAIPGLTKDDIRALSRELGLPTWNKPAMACLSSRFPYGTEITTGLLERVAKAEEQLRNLGFTQFRVRHHGDIARIEVPRDSLARFLDEEVSRSITRSLKELGYVYVTLDLEGFRSGSMNEVLKS